MPMRNLTIIMLAALLSWACYLRASRNRYVATLTDAMNIISADYVDDVEQRKLFEGAMGGMVGQLDPYSGYTSPEDLQQFDEQMNQEFVGIGIFVELDPVSKRLKIKSPLPGTPAFKAGIKPDDVIMAIDEKDTTGMTLKDSTTHIKGQVGTTVKLSILHAGETVPVDITIQRELIPTESVYGDVRDEDGKWVFHLLEKPNIGYIRVHNFGERTAREMEAALESFSQPGQGVEGLILDLRGNAGGLLNVAIEVCDQFLDEGTIVSTKGRNNQDRAPPDVATKGVKISPDIPLVVLVDKFSASASEIVAACLQDNHRAVVAGQRSWGKGTVQNIIKLEGGRSALRLTVARYSRPSGKNIHKSANAKDTDEWGVSPDSGLEVNLTNEELENWVRGRRERDFLTSTGQLRNALAQSGTQGPQEKPEEGKSDEPGELEYKEPSSAIGPPSPLADDEADKTTPSKPGSYDDPQLQKAIDYLLERLLKASEPRPA